MPHGLSGRERLLETPPDEQHADCIDRQYYQDDVAGHCHQPTEPVYSHGVPHEHSLRQGDALAHEDQEESGKSGEAEASYQHEREDDPMSEVCPIGGCGLHGMARYRDRRRRGEKRHIQWGEPALSTIGYGKRQEKPTHHYQKEEGVKKDVRRREVPGRMTYTGALYDFGQGVPKPGTTDDSVGYSPGAVHGRRRVSSDCPCTRRLSLERRYLTGHCPKV